MSQDQTVNDPLIGTVVDRRYKVLKRLGVGGMGIVYKVEHSFLNKFFALKVMRPTKDETDRKRFEQEARLASVIRHPNVVEISDFGVLPTNQPYYVMEFLSGQTVGDAIFAGFMDSQLVCHIGVQIARGLQSIHKQNVVHRDLKPDNIFLIDPDKTGENQDENSETGDSEPAFVKIMDFGIAKSVNSHLTGTGMTVGTPEYMSPEQARGETVDWRSDQYSLGCILYEMLTREIPFDGKGAFEVMYKHLNAQPVPPRKRRPERADFISSELEAIVLKMLAKKPKDRHPSMRVVELALRDEAARLLLSGAGDDTMVGSTPVHASNDSTPLIRTLEDTRKTVPFMPVAAPPETMANRPTKKIDIKDQAEMMNLIGRIGGIVHSPRSLPPASVQPGVFQSILAWFARLWQRLARLWK
ncbi:MAG TPA: serine/threonine-protein kinase [Pseudomonadota bacterium]|nr:serine/threonine-protein kinase [Pseudomonadota bacterium]